MAAGITYTPLATTTLGSAAASVEFTSISGSYTDLILVSFPKRTTQSDAAIYAYPNSDTTGNLASHTAVYGNGTSALSNRRSNSNGVRIGVIGTGEAGTQIAQFMNYANTNVFKTVLSRENRAEEYTFGVVSLWRNTNAITSLLIQVSDASNFASGSTFSLYGITAA
jgi:hypothetical protein